MAQNPPDGTPRAVPYLFYNDVSGALDWLAEAFGFSTRLTLPGPGGAPVHAEMELADALVMLGPASRERQCQSPADLGAVSQSLYVYVDDVDAHCERARSAGATIVSEPEDMFWGDRMYYARDCEGHHWNFAQHVKDVSPEDLKPPGC